MIRNSDINDKSNPSGDGMTNKNNIDLHGLIVEAREYAAAELAIHEASLRKGSIGDKPDDSAASNAELFHALADALASLSASNKSIPAP